MSYTLGRARVVAIVEGTVPTTKERGLGDKFKHDPAAGGDQPVSAERRFWLESAQARRWGPAQAVANVVSYDVALVVEYKNHATDRAALDRIIASDYEAITARLLNQGLWDRDNSTIRAIGADALTQPDAPLFPREIVDVEGGRRLRILFQLEVFA